MFNIFFNMLGQDKKDSFPLYLIDNNLTLNFHNYVRVCTCSYVIVKFGLIHPFCTDALKITVVCSQ